MKQQDVKKVVRETYGKIGAGESTGCCAPSCCSPGVAPPSPEETSQQLGYSAEDVTGVPQGANLGLGCGNPQAIAALKPGETVLDLGSGGGFDCFLAAKQVGPSGHVIGVDMTPEMLARARSNASEVGADNVEFRLGEIEHLPVADGTVDVIISNCVINLSPDKPAVFREAFRVLTSGGRLAISDVVASAPLPQAAREDPALLAGCMGGAVLINELEAMLRDAGFTQVRVDPKEGSRELIQSWDPNAGLEDFLVSANIEAIRP